MRVLILPLLAALAACAHVPDGPAQVTVVVERYRPLPAWATEPLPATAPTDGTVLGYVRGFEARGVVLDLADCHRRLLAKLDRGETVDHKACEP